MLTELCAFLKNWFEVDKLYGDFIIADGVMTYADGAELPLQDGQYFRIIGSVFNDGVYKHSPHSPEGSTPPLTNSTPSGALRDETFSGSVWAMAVPKEVEAIAEEIADWMSKYGGADSAALSPFNSESFGGYSYSKSGGGAGADGSGTGSGGWESAFGNRLSRYRKV